LNGPLPDGPFKGVPFLLKDLFAEMADTPLSEGSVFLQNHYVSAVDSEIVRRFKAAGLIVLGKTNTPEFGSLPTTEPAAFGATRNPWDLERSPGGSSGGSAAAVAAGMVAMGHANDGGGSIRVPASCCGLVGLKPTRGRISLGPHYGDAGSGIVSEFVVTRSVRDSVTMIDAISGPALGDPYFATPPARSYAQEIADKPSPLRIALCTTPLSGRPADPDCVAAATAAAALCQSLGHDVEEAMPDLDGAAVMRDFAANWIGLQGWAIDDWSQRMGRPPVRDAFEPATWATYQASRRQTGADYLRAVQNLQAVSRTVAAFMTGYDVWLTPTLAVPPLPLGAFSYAPETRTAFLENIAASVGFTEICNITGQPALSLPLHVSAAGLPIGVQLIGRYGDEVTLLRLAAALEAAEPWAARRPADCA
jgi:amidase